MSFAEKQLSKYGWIKGQGLGKESNGLTEPIRVKMKRDNGGVGLPPGADLTCDWWSKVFNSAANSINVAEGSEKGEVTIETQADSTSHLKKKHYDSHRRKLTYGRFLASSSTQYPRDEEGMMEVKSKRAKVMDESDRKKEESKAKNIAMTDEMLFKACGGRTAHKGARHGLTLSGKLSRIQHQEEVTNSRSPTSASEGQGSQKSALMQPQETVTKNRKSKKRKHYLNSSN